MLREVAYHLQLRPFQPFEIESTSGRVHKVMHPENAAIVGNRIVAVADEDGESAYTLNALHIASVKGPHPVEQ